jgi:hypothetical protein
VQPKVSTAIDNSVGPPAKTVIPGAESRPADFRSVEEVLGLLARAVQQLHTYPATSRLCITALDACHRGLTGLASREALTFRVTPDELMVDGVRTGKGSQVGLELARRLHKAAVAAVTIDRAVTPRELGRFCEDLVKCGDRDASGATLLEMVTEHGVDRITVTMATRPEVLEVGAVDETTAGEAGVARARFEALIARGGVVNHLYPPEKGWVRVDPASAPSTVSLLDLAVLADDPATLASMLLRLTDEAGDVRPADALERKYSDVAMLISALDPRMARRMFGKLARAVLDLEPDSRQALLRRTVLPGLLDGRVDGAILRDFPDVDLAESLCLLLDLETAAPELLSTALSRLDLPEDRRAAMLPLLDERLREREEATSDSARQTTLARHARELVRVDGVAGKSFAEFEAFDLALDEAAHATLEQIRAAVPATDVTDDQLMCLWHLMCLEPNPDAVDGFLAKSRGLLAELDAASRATEVTAWLARYSQLGTRVREARPDVAAVIAHHLTAFCTPERAAWIVELADSGPGGRQAAGEIIVALGPAVAAPLAALLEGDSAGPRGAQGRGRAVTQLLLDHAALLAPALVPLLEPGTPGVRRTLLRVLGAAGPGYEGILGAHVVPGDEHTAREALRALARIGTPQAAAPVVAQILRQDRTLGSAAEETLWHFPAAVAGRHTRELLARRDFTTNHPKAAERLLDRAARAGGVDLGPALLDLAPLRFRIWQPAVARMARKAHGMLTKS